MIKTRSQCHFWHSVRAICGTALGLLGALRWGYYWPYLLYLREG